MFIILLLVLLSFPFYISINKQLTMDRAATRLVQDIRKAIEMTMSAQKFEGSYPDGGYGVHFPSGSSGKYYLFADNDGDRVYGAGELVETIEIEGEIEINERTASFSSITFLAPEPKVYLNDSSGIELLGAEAYVLFSDGSNQNYIYINKAGLVYIP